MTDIQSMEQWDQLAQEIYDTFNINPAIADSKGKMIAGGMLFANELCRRIKKDPKGLASICSVAGQFFTAQLHEEKRTQAHECDAGMVKIAIPLLVQGELVGSIGGCGIVPMDGEVDSFFVARSLGVKEHEFAGHMQKMPTMDSAKIEEICAWLENKAAELAAR